MKCWQTRLIKVLNNGGNEGHYSEHLIFASYGLDTVNKQIVHETQVEYKLLTTPDVPPQHTLCFIILKSCICFQIGGSVNKRQVSGIRSFIK